MLRNRKFACFSFAAIIFIILPLVLSCDKKQVAAPEEKPYASASEAVKNQNAAAGIEDYMAILSLDSPQVAEPHAGAEPDRGLYYQSWESGVNQIYRRDGDETRAVTSAAQFPEGTDFFSLSPHGEYMVIGADVGGDEQFDLYIKDMCANTAPQPFDSGRESRAENPVWYDDKIGRAHV